MAQTGDLVLVHIENKPGFYARLERITPDVKPGWWQVKLLVLTFPLQVYTWILDETQINGAPFTMGGTPIMLELLKFPAIPDEKPEALSGGSDKKEDAARKGAKIVSLSDRKKEKE
jgi:hypothetical protein